MSQTNEPAHLIERAASMLRRTGETGGGGRFGVVELPSVNRAEQSEAPLQPQSPTIDASNLERLGAIDWNRGRTRIAEEFRIVQSQMLRNATNAPGGSARVVMITSARPSEGKSFITLNLALSIARHGEYRSLLVDVDGKPGSISDVLGMAGQPGLLELASDPALDPETLISPTTEPNLSVLALGKIRDRSPELLGSKMMVRVLERIGARFPDRFTLLDTPPCLMSSDPHRLAPSVGQTVVVVEAGTTQIKDIEGVLDLVRACPIASLLLNRLTVSGPHASGYGYGYGYGSAAR